MDKLNFFVEVVKEFETGNALEFCCGIDSGCSI